MTLDFVKKVYSFWGKRPYFYGLVTRLTFLGQEKNLRSAAVSRLNLKEGDTVIDLACGTGRNFSYLIKEVGLNGRSIGLDYNQDMLDAAKKLIKKHGWHNIKLIQGDAADFNIDVKADGAISVLGMSATPRPDLAIGKIYNSLKTGGRLSVCDARLFVGFWSIFNPLIKLIYKIGAAWDWRKNVPKEMENVFGNVVVKRFLGGSFYIAVSKK